MAAATASACERSSGKTSIWVASALVVALREVRADDRHPPLVRLQQPTGVHAQVHARVVPGLRLDAGQQLRDVEAADLVRVEQRLQHRRRAFHAIDPLDLVDEVSRDRPRAGLEAGGRARVEDEDPRPEVVLATGDEHVQLLGQRTHDGERENADDDAEDGEPRAQLAPGDVADGFAHGPMQMLDGVTVSRRTVRFAPAVGSALP
jgi:hypothetical protein